MWVEKVVLALSGLNLNEKDPFDRVWIVFVELCLLYGCMFINLSLYDAYTEHELF